jgi:hypothetical protein
MALGANQPLAFTPLAGAGPWLRCRRSPLGSFSERLETNNTFSSPPPDPEYFTEKEGEGRRAYKNVSSLHI